MTQTVEVATLGGGCFWCLEAVFLGVEGVSAVESGYAGGQTQRPTYEQVCDGDTGHAEVVKVEFDPSTISYREILDIFFAIHDPTQLNRQGNDVGTQYRSAVFTHSVSTMGRSLPRCCRSTATTGRPKPIIRTILRSTRTRAIARSSWRQRWRSFVRSSRIG
jgi:methionine-S-sulfoxide reductase